MSDHLHRRRSVLMGLTSVMTMAAIQQWGQPARSQSSSLSSLVLYGAPIGVSLPLARIADQNTLQPVAHDIEFQMWRSPDEMRAGVASGQIEITTSPAPTAANLYNRGTGMRLVGVLTTGMLYLITTDPNLRTLADLAGQSILVPFRGDMPDRVLQLLLQSQAMTPNDVQLNYTATPIEAAQLLLAGRSPAAVMQEPAATAAMVQGAANRLTVLRALDLQAEFATATGRGPDIPMAVLLLQDSLRTQYEDLPAVLLKAVREATDWVNANPAPAATLGETHLDLKQAILERSIPYMNLKVRSAQQVREHLEFFYSALATESMDLLGGALPDDGFYLDVN